MKSSLEIVEAVRAKLGGVSYYQVAKALGVRDSYIYNIKSGRDSLGKKSAMKAAEILDCEPAYLISITNMERADDETLRASWERIVQQAATAMTVLLCILCQIEERPLNRTDSTP